MAYRIYGKTDCIFCDKAKALLDENGLSYVYYDVMDDIEARQDLLEAIPEVRTVPQIFLDDEYIGGFDELNAKFNNT